MSDTPAIASRVILVALSDLRYPDWNPRTFFDEDEMQDLMNYIKAGGKVPPIIIWQGPNDQSASSSSELAHPSHGSQLVASTQGPWDVISGKRRCEAYRRLGKTHIEAIKRDCTLEEAMFEAIASNRDSKPFWLNDYVAIEKIKLKFATVTQVDIINRTGWPKDRVSRAVNLIRLLNPASRQLIEKSAPKKVVTNNFSVEEDDLNTAKPGIWRLPEQTAWLLIPYLKKRPLDEAQAFTQKALQMMITQQLTPSETREMLAQAASGQDLAQFKPTAKVKKARTASTPAGSQGHAPSQGVTPSVNTSGAASAPPSTQSPKADAPGNGSDEKLDWSNPAEVAGAILGIGLFVGLVWLALKVLGWVISLFWHSPH